MSLPFADVCNEEESGDHEVVEQDNRYAAVVEL